MFKKYTILELQWGGDGQDKNTVKPRFNIDSDGAIESVHINVLMRAYLLTHL